MTEDLMRRQLDRIRNAYDLTVEQYRRGINPYDDVPADIKESAFYKSLMKESNALGSGAPNIKEYLSPEPGMRFLDAGCSANLVNYRLDRWPSGYYGVDVSPALIDAMNGFVIQEDISIGGLYVADIADMPFKDGFFDIAAVIGVLEYGTLDYIVKALGELNRVCKPGAGVVLDIPNKNHPHAKDMMKLEKYLGRPNYHHARIDFEKLLAPLFSIERLDDSRVMMKYFLRTLK